MVLYRYNDRELINQKSSYKILSVCRPIDLGDFEFRTHQHDRGRLHPQTQHRQEGPHQHPHPLHGRELKKMILKELSLFLFLRVFETLSVCLFDDYKKIVLSIM